MHVYVISYRTKCDFFFLIVMEYVICTIYGWGHVKVVVYCDIIGGEMTCFSCFKTDFFL